MLKIPKLPNMNTYKTYTSQGGMKMKNKNSINYESNAEINLK